MSEMIESNGFRFYPHQSKGLRVVTYKYEDYNIYAFIYLTDNNRWAYSVRYKGLYAYRDKEIENRYDKIVASTIELTRKLNKI